MQRRPSPRQRYRAASRASRIGMGVRALLLSCACVGTGVLVALVGGALLGFPLAGETSHATTPLPATPAVPTATAQPPSTPRPGISAAAAILGGSVVAFDTAFGANTCCFANEWDGYPGPYGPTSTGVITKEDGTSWDETSRHRVIGIETSPQGPGGTWTAAQETAMCRSFMPPDATDLGTHPVYLGKYVVGSETTYSSQLLAQTLPAADFTDTKGKAVQPGWFFVYRDEEAAVTPGTYSRCALSTDEQFALQPY